MVAFYDERQSPEGSDGLKNIPLTEPHADAPCADNDVAAFPSTFPRELAIEFQPNWFVVHDVLFRCLEASLSQDKTVGEEFAAGRDPIEVFGDFAARRIGAPLATITPAFVVLDRTEIADLLIPAFAYGILARHADDPAIVESGLRFLSFPPRLILHRDYARNSEGLEHLLAHEEHHIRLNEMRRSGETELLDRMKTLFERAIEIASLTEAQIPGLGQVNLGELLFEYTIVDETDYEQFWLKSIDLDDESGFRIKENPELGLAPVPALAAMTRGILKRVIDNPKAASSGLQRQVKELYAELHQQRQEILVLARRGVHSLRELGEI